MILVHFLLKIGNPIENEVVKLALRDLKNKD